MLPQEIFWILTPSSPLSWVSESFRWDIGQFNSPRIKHLSNPFSRFQPGKFFFIKNIFIMKNLTDFRKTLETGLGPRLFVYPPMICSPLFAKQYGPAPTATGVHTSRNKWSSLLSQLVTKKFNSPFWTKLWTPPPPNQIFLDLPLTSRFPCIHSIPKHCVHPHSALKSRIPAFKYKVNTGLQKPIGIMGSLCFGEFVGWHDSNEVLNQF